MPFILVCLLLFSASPSWAEAPLADRTILVEAAPILDETIEVSRSVDIITSHDIEQKNRATVADILRDVPGVDVVRQGAPGQTTSVFIRGARSEDTLVLIDGAEANDAMSPSCGYDFSTLAAENIERIEIYRGPQSVRFGGGALGGVINIITKQGAGVTHGHYAIEGGSYDTVRTNLGLLGAHKGFSYTGVVDGFRTHGFSAADERDGNTERDGAKIGSASTKLAWESADTTRVQATLRYTNADVAIDRRGGANGDDPNDTARSSQILTGVEAQRRFLSEQLKSTLGFFYSEVRRSDHNDPDALSTTSSSDFFLSENQKIESNHELTLGNHHLLKLGLQYKRESGVATSMFGGSVTPVARTAQNSEGEALTYLYENTNWFGDIGARADEVSTIRAIPSERASLGRSFASTGTRLSTTYGTGFKVPSLYQLYSTYGTTSLRHESSDTAEFTVEQKFSPLLSGSIAYFNNHYRDMIDFDTASSKYLNISSARSQGFEVQFQSALSSRFALKGQYTYLDSVDGSTGLSLLRRPRHAASTQLTYSEKRFEAFSDFHYEGQRPDTDPITFTRTTDAAYAIAGVGGSFKFYSLFKISARIENLFDRRYEEVSGYGTAGRSYYFSLAGDI